MHLKKLLALASASLVIVLTPGALAARGSGTKLTVRIEGASKTLLAPSAVQTRHGWITKGKTPRGSCPATSAAGALDAATHHRWGGKYTKYGLEVLSILGERHTFKSSYYWGIWVNNRYGTAGACAIKLRRGDHVLFAADSVGRHEHPIGIRAPHQATVGHPFTIKAVSFSDAGVASPLAGVRVSTTGKSAVTNAKGIVQVNIGGPGKVVVHAQRKGYIRAAAVSVHVVR